MKRKHWLAIVLIAFGVWFVDSGVSVPVGAQPLTHTVEKGDTLWDICEKYYGNEELWPKLWQMNPFITNPHLLKPGDVAVLDILSHASIYDGARLAGAKIKIFSHNNPKHLEKVLKNLKTKRAMVCVEGVYSMDGDLANLSEIVPICKKYGAKVLVDEAHASLIFGKKGSGVAEHFGIPAAWQLSRSRISRRSMSQL